MVADGVTTSTITVQLKDAFNNNLISGGDTVALATDLGTMGSVTDNSDGSYTATLTSATTTGTATITGTVNAAAITDTATVTLTPGAADGTTSLITAAPTSMVADGVTTSTITVQLKDADNNNLTSGGDTVALATDLGTIGSVTDNTNGTHGGASDGSGHDRLGHRQYQWDLHGDADLGDDHGDCDDYRYVERGGDDGHCYGDVASWSSRCHDIADHSGTDIYGCRRSNDFDDNCAA
jgi:uncharacterized Zn ribbon protein